MSTTVIVEGTKLGIGSYVGFKCDIEQTGEIVEIQGASMRVRNEGGFDGDYIGGDTETWVDAYECWVV